MKRLFPGNTIAAISARRMSLRFTPRTVSPSACMYSMRLKNACEYDMYMPAFERVISQSRPPDGAIAFVVLIVEYIRVPAFAPQNHESLKGRPPCADPRVGSTPTRARAVVRARIVRINATSKVKFSGPVRMAPWIGRRHRQPGHAEAARRAGQCDALLSS